MPTHQTARVSLTAAQILNLGTTPVQIVAGSPGQILVVYNSYIRLFAGTTAFNPAADDLIGFYLGNLTNTYLLEYPGALRAVGFLDQTVDMSQWHDGWMGSGAPADATADILGSGLNLVVANNASGLVIPKGSNWTQGNGTGLVLVEYSYVTP
jgi:hypothetical protein